MQPIIPFTSNTLHGVRDRDGVQYTKKNSSTSGGPTVLTPVDDMRETTSSVQLVELTTSRTVHFRLAAMQQPPTTFDCLVVGR
jgi:hypothetical protein